MLFDDTYKTIATKSEGIYKEKGSKFIALAYPVTTEDEIKEIIAGLKKEYYDARHHCYAYILGPDKSAYRQNDDGEPSGTAGRQILAQIDAAGLRDILVVVVRYFGGILLGVPGLIAAYRAAAADAIANAPRLEKTASRTWTLQCGYDALPEVENGLKSIGLQPQKRDFAAECIFVLEVPLGKETMFKEKFYNFIK